MEWLNTTPLGAPLVPDVNAIMAGSELNGSNALSNLKPVAADSSSIDCSATAPEVLMMCARRASGSCGSIMTKGRPEIRVARMAGTDRSEEHTSELQSLMRISYAVFCLKKK